MKNTVVTSRSLGKRFAKMMTFMFLIYLFLMPLEGRLIVPTIRLSSWLSSLIFEHVYVIDNSILIGGTEIEIVDACTPTIFWALLLAYILLDWRGKRSLATLLVGIPVVFLVNAFRIPVIALLLNRGMSFQAAHKLAEYFLFLPTMSLLVVLNTKK